MPLKGRGDSLWVSPSDLLIGKIALRPPFTPKCLQALTHKGILDIGLDLENKFREEMELDKMKALEKYKIELLASVEDRMKSEIKDVEVRERLACRIEMKKLQQQFEITLKEELDKLEATIRKPYKEIMANHESDFKAKWEEKLQKEVKKTVDTMTKEYLARLDEQEKRLTQIFVLELKKAQTLRDYDAKLNKLKTVEALRQLKHNLECTNLVNMMYVLCNERQKCCVEKLRIENHYKDEIKRLKDRIKQKNDLIVKLTSDKYKEIKEISILEKCLFEVIKHFQKFINFALRAAPTQAEFLLSIEKMMVFALTNEIAKTECPKRRDAPVIIPWRHEGTSTAPSLQVSSLEIRDYHDCLRELNPPIKDDGSQLGENDILPAMYFKNKTYIREDFRDMLSAGVKLSPSNEFWNKDVEILVNKWREEYPDQRSSITKDSIGEPDDYLMSSVDKLDPDGSMHSDRRSSYKSATVQFSVDESPLGSRNERRSIHSRKLGPKPTLKPNSYTFVENVNLDSLIETRSVATLLAAKDSLELHFEKIKKQKESISEEYTQAKVETRTVEEHPSSRDEQDKELVVKTRDSIIKRMSEMVKTPSSGEFLASPKDSIELTKPRLSKLALARNSVEILKESLQKLKQPSVVCQRKDTRKYDDSMPPTAGLQGTCCDRCKRSSIQRAASDPTRNSIADSIGDGDERSVRISRIEIINLDDRTTSNVLFQHEPKEDAPHKRTRAVDARSSKSSKRSSKRKVKRKKVPMFQCKVSGGKEAKGGDQTNDEFTANRIHSLVKLMSDQPHLIQLFTAGLR